MNILVIGGTRYFGINLVKSLLRKGHKITIATRGKTKDQFGQNVERLIIERTNPDSIAEVLGNRYFDVVCDNLAYCSNDVRYLLDSINCGRYVMTSSASVYKNQHLLTSENEFDPLSYPLKWCSRGEFFYDEIKRQSECALFQEFSRIPAVSVRFPYVIGEDDYTQRLYFYIEQTFKGKPMNLDNLDEQIGFISSVEAGSFLAWSTEQEFTGTINGNNIGTISLREIIYYIKEKSGVEAVFSEEGLTGPYNGQKTFSLNTMRAYNLGYHFMELKPWIYSLLDKYKVYL